MAALQSSIVAIRTSAYDPLGTGGVISCTRTNCPHAHGERGFDVQAAQQAAHLVQSWSHKSIRHRSQRNTPVAHAVPKTVRGLTLSGIASRFESTSRSVTIMFSLRRSSNRHRAIGLRCHIIVAVTGQGAKQVGPR